MKFPVDRTVVVLDHSLLAQQEQGGYVVLKDNVTLKKSLWTCMLEASVEYARVALDLYGESRMLCVVSAGAAVRHLNSWDPADQNISKILDELPRIGDPNEDVPLVDGIRAAVDLLASTSGLQTDQDVEGTTNRCRILCLVARPGPMKATDEPLQHFLVESPRGQEEGEANPSQDLRTFTNRLIRTKNRDQLMGAGGSIPIDHCELCVLNICSNLPMNPDTSIPPFVPLTQLSKHLGYCAYTVGAAQLADVGVNLVQLHCSLAHVRLVDMAMKESSSSQGAVKYEMVLMCTTDDRSADSTCPLFLDRPTDESVIYCSPEERKKGELVLSWESRFKLNNDLLPTKSMQRVTPIDPAAMHVNTAIKHIMAGNKVCMATVGPSGSLDSNPRPTHVLLSQGADIFLCQLHANSHLDLSLPFTSDEVTTKCPEGQPQPRTEEFCAFIRATQLTISVRGGMGRPVGATAPTWAPQDVKPIITEDGVAVLPPSTTGEFYWMPEYLKRFTSAVEPIASSPVLFNRSMRAVQEHIRHPIVDVLLKEKATAQEIETAAKQVERLIKERDTMEATLFADTAPAGRSAQFQQMVKELRDFAQGLLVTPKGSHLVLGLLHQLQVERPKTPDVKMEEGETVSAEAAANREALAASVAAGKIVITAPTLDSNVTDSVQVHAMEEVWSTFDKLRNMTEREKEDWMNSNTNNDHVWAKGHMLPVKEEAKPRPTTPKVEFEEVETVLSLWRRRRDEVISQRADFEGRTNYTPYRGRQFGRAFSPNPRGRKRPADDPPSHAQGPTTPGPGDRGGRESPRQMYKDKDRPRSNKDRDRDRERGRDAERGDSRRDRSRERGERPKEWREGGGGHRDKHGGMRGGRDQPPFKRWRKDEGGLGPPSGDGRASPYPGQGKHNKQRFDRDRPQLHPPQFP